MTVPRAEALERRIAGRLAGRLASRVQSRGVPLAAQVASWIDLVELCRELDDVLVEAGSPSPENLALHEAVVNLAIGCGGWLIHQLRTNGVEFSASGQTFETLEASLEMLRAFYRTWHPDFSPEEIEAVRQSVFHGAA